MAPERFDGWSDPRSDVYALGATLYELLTLRPAFEETDRVKLIEKVLHESPPPLRPIDRQIPRDLETIVLKALAKAPGERYASWPSGTGVAMEPAQSWPGHPERLGGRPVAGDEHGTSRGGDVA
jgi:serine/threonine protein kinase